MSDGFNDRMGWVARSANLSASLGRAFTYAYEQGHKGVTVEHLLLALTEDPDAGALLSASGIELNGLRSEVAGFVSRQNDRFNPGEAGQPVATAELSQIFEYASAAAEQSGRDRIDGAIVLAALIGEGRSPAAELLKTHGLTFERAVQSLHRRNIGAEPPATRLAASQPSTRAAASGLDRKGRPAATGEGEPRARGEPLPGLGKARRFRADEDVLESVRRRLAEGDTGADGRAVMADPSGTRAQPTRREPRPERDVAHQAPGRDAPRSGPPTGGRADVAPAGVLAGDAPPVGERGLSGGDRHRQAALPERDASGAYADGQPSPGMRSQRDPATARGPEARTMPRRDTAYPDQPDAGAFGTPPDRRQPAGSSAAASAGAAAEPRRGTPPGGQQPGQGQPPTRQVSRDHMQTAQRYPAPGQAPAEQDFPPASAREPAEQPANTYRPEPPPGSQGYPSSYARPEEQGPAVADHGPGSMRTAPPDRSPPEHGMHGPPQGRGDVVAKRPSMQPRDTAERAFGADEPRSGLLVENIPRTMVVAVPEAVEVRMARSDVEALAEGLQGRGMAQTHDVFVTRAMSVRLRAPQGGFWIESSSPETQWVERMGGLLQDDFACWRWTVLPERRGRARLQLIVSARTVAPDGMTAETALPDQVIDLKVRTNYRESAKKWAGWAAAALAGGLLGASGQQAWGTLSRIFGS